MSTANEVNPVETTDNGNGYSDNLDEFTKELFSANSNGEGEYVSTDTPEPEVEEDASENETTEDSGNEQTSDDVEPSATEQEDGASDEAEETAEDAKPAPKKKSKQTAQERINEVVGKQRETERQLADALKKLEELQQASNKPTDPEPETKPAPKAEAVDGPNPDEVNEDGTDKYPLGDIDPQYIRDLTKYTFHQELKEQEAAKEAAAEQAKVEQARANITTEWNEKLVEARGRYEDFQEKGENLVSVFEGIDPQYGEYLTETLMTMERGPDVLYYLANNLDVAQDIVNSGARSATIALGRLESQFVNQETVSEPEAKPSNVRVSQAPTPPAHQNKGSAVSGGPSGENGYSDDLDVFAKQLFSKMK